MKRKLRELKGNPSCKISLHEQQRDQLLTSNLTKYTDMKSLYPTLSHDFDAKKVASFIKEHSKSESDAKAWKSFFEHSTYISFESWLVNFTKAIRQFLDQNPAPFLILVPLQTPFEKKSNYWLSILAEKVIRSLGRKAEAVTTIMSALLEYPQVKNVLVVDDAVYSGLQMSVNLGEMRDQEDEVITECPELQLQRKKYFLLTPYCTKKALARMDGTTKICPIEMPTLRESLGAKNEELQEAVKRAFRNYTSGLNLDHYPIVFQHKLPDFWSSYPQIYTRVLENCEEGQTDCFVPHYQKLF
jgi:hypoxanthine phosphoribosyltransferase